MKVLGSQRVRGGGGGTRCGGGDGCGIVELDIAVVELDATKRSWMQWQRSYTQGGGQT